jgi:SagB-type dehydrogenase family enzyme
LHSRSRHGHYDGPFGGVYPFIHDIAPQPAIKPLPSGRKVELYRPSWADIQARDPFLTAVLERRTSVRRHGQQPLTADQLGEFLYRVARVRAKCGPSADVPYEVTSRPWPCGGGAYELELYLTVQRCTGLSAGIYYYDAVGHRLILINENATDRQSLVRVASVASGGTADPQVLITVTSRFQRLSWKYRAIAYSVTLRNVGVLYQTMYLVATAMSLAPCGLGSGNSELAERIFGLDYLRESAVGDFILGSAPGQPMGTRFSEAWKGINDPEWATYACQELTDGDISAASDGGL